VLVVDPGVPEFTDFTAGGEEAPAGELKLGAEPTLGT